MADKRILIVDADASSAEAIAAICRNFNFRVGILPHGEGLLDAIEESHPDLILMAVELPDGNGFVLCKKLKADVKLRKIPLILLSNQSDPEVFSKHRKLKDAADGYLLKPVTPEDLIDQIEHLIGLAPPPSSKDILQESNKRELELSRVVEKKEREIAMLRESFESVSAKLERAKEESSGFAKERAEFEAKVKKLQKEHQKQVANLEESIRATADEIQSERSELDQNRDVLFEKIASLVTETEDLKKQLETHERKTQLADEENAKREAGLKERIKELLAQVDEERQTNEGYKKEFAEIEGRHRQSVADIQLQLQQLEQERIKMEQRVVKAYKKIKMDQVRDEKIQKAIEVITTLLSSSGSGETR